MTGIAPVAGRTAGGTRVVLTGSDFTGATGVRFGSAHAVGYTVYADNRMAAYSPPGRKGQVHITVTGPNGTSTPKATDTFTHK